MKMTAIAYQAAAALLFVGVLVLIHATVESGMNDDWSFILTARSVAETGRLHYNGWSAPLIGFQAYWGALFIRLFGFSFLAVRASVMSLTVLSIPVLWSLFRAVGAGEKQAFFGLLMFLLSPLNLPDLATFMTDMPAFFLFAASLLAAMKAWDAESDNRATIWICAATVCGILSGSVRQVYWLSSVCSLGVLALKRMRSLRGRLLIGVCIGVTVAFGAAASHWLAAQPYVPTDSTMQDLKDLSWSDIADASGKGLGRYLVGVALLSVPFWLLFAVETARRMRAWVQVLIWAVALAFTYWLAQPMPWLGNTLTQYGILRMGTVSVGQKPLVLSPLAMLALASLGVATAAYACREIIRIRRASAPNKPSGRFAILSLPFLVGYIAVIVFRAPAFGLYDRYEIPAVFVVTTIAIGLYGTKRVGALSWVAGIVLVLYAAATTHDYFAETRAKLKATEAILRAGHNRTEVLSGFEFDCWTQAELTGHINNDALNFPADAFQEADDCNGPDEVREWWRSLTPSLKARYVISLTPVQGLAESEFAPVEYWRWLPLGKYKIYVERAPGDPLTCHA